MCDYIHAVSVERGLISEISLLVPFLFCPHLSSLPGLVLPYCCYSVVKNYEYIDMWRGRIYRFPHGENACLPES